MNSQEMVLENILTASSTNVGDLGFQEEQMLKDVVNAINSKMKVGCTGCGYCMPCPKNVDIPGTFSAYNRRYTDSKYGGFFDYVMCTALRKNSTAASNCIECGKCEKHCPQQIDIRRELKNASRELERPLYRAIRKIVQLLKVF